MAFMRPLFCGWRVGLECVLVVVVVVVVVVRRRLSPFMAVFVLFWD
jgi:hypothetical protein